MTHFVYLLTVDSQPLAAHRIIIWMGPQRSSCPTSWVWEIGQITVWSRAKYNQYGGSLMHKR